jgi:nitric oxide dioxygenase
MALDDDALDALRASYRDLARDPTRLADAFYQRLFEIAPEVRPLFRHDLEAQALKMMSTLGAIVAQIHEIDALRPMMADLARRHVAYGVRAPHYDVAGEALLWAIERTHGARFSPAVGDAWRAAYALLAEAMLAVTPEGRRGA